MEMLDFLLLETFFLYGQSGCVIGSILQESRSRELPSLLSLCCSPAHFKMKTRFQASLVWSNSKISFI